MLALERFHTGSVASRPPNRVPSVWFAPLALDFTLSAKPPTAPGFAEVIAHEVLQPLAAVTANADAILRWLAGGPPNLDRARACLERIARDGKQAGEVITRVRALVKKSPPTKAWLDLMESIQEALVVINIEAERHQVSVGTELAAGLPLLQADRVQLQQVVLNMVMNGIDAMKAVTDRPRELLIKSQPHESGYQDLPSLTRLNWNRSRSGPVNSLRAPPIGVRPRGRSQNAVGDLQCG